jgi:hypothetical protein
MTKITTRTLLLVVIAAALVLAPSCRKEESATATTDTATTTSAMTEAPQAATIDPPPGPEIPYVVAHPELDHAGFAEFAWREFVALNWPAAIDQATKLPVRGQADTALQFADQPSRPRVWETWKSDWEIVGTADPAVPPNPTEWSSWKVNGGVNICDKSGNANNEHVLMVMATPGQMVRGINQANTGPLIDQNENYVRYETRLNQSEYQTILDKKWYIAANLPKPPTFPEFEMSTPGKYGAIELKISWRELAPGESGDTFYVVPAKIVDPGPNPVCRDAKLAMLGMHISHKSDPRRQWIWSTFEHINNVPDGAPVAGVKYSLNDGDPNNQNLPAGYSWKGPDKFPKHLNPTDPLPPKGDPQRQKIQVVRAVPIDPKVRVVNDTFRNAAPVRGTVFANYILVAHQWPIKMADFKVPPPNKYPDGAGGPFPVSGQANTTMETYLQNLPASDKTNSCMSCHYSFAARRDFSFVLGGAWAPPSINEAPGAKATPNLSPELQSLQDELRQHSNK